MYLRIYLTLQIPRGPFLGPERFGWDGKKTGLQRIKRRRPPPSMHDPTTRFTLAPS